MCVDGISEVLTVMLHRMHQRGHPTDLDEPVALTAGDTGDTWVVWPRRPSDQVVPLQPVGSSRGPVSLPPAVEHRRDGPVPVPDQVEAPAAVLYRLLWQRPVDHTELLIAGDQDAGRGRSCGVGRAAPP